MVLFAYSNHIRYVCAKVVVMLAIVTDVFDVELVVQLVQLLHVHWKW